MVHSQNRFYMGFYERSKWMPYRIIAEFFCKFSEVIRGKSKVSSRVVLVKGFIFVFYINLSIYESKNLNFAKIGS